MIDQNIYFKDNHENNYLYNYDLKHFLFIPPFDNDNYLDCSDSNSMREQSYSNKHKFLNSLPSNDTAKGIRFITKPNPELLKKKLANLRQLLFEVTDGCNLNCKYCGYGELYDNYDKRNATKLSFEKVKLTIDYLVDLWNSPLNTSHNNTVDVGFYGGEPLANTKLIKKTINYLNDRYLNSINFSYRMTTNAVLLDKHMDYLVENNFSLLISLDGNEYNNSYRVTSNGENSFDLVYKNISLLKEKYPDYYREKVNYNAVLHDRNSVAEIYSFIRNNLEKVPRITALNSNGVKEDKQELFSRMFNDNYLSMQQAIQTKGIENDIRDVDPEMTVVNSIINSYSGNTFFSLNDLLRKKEMNSYLPTGTCLAFHKKIFITVNGKILPCEKIGQSKPLGTITDERINIDFESISNMYDAMYSSVVNLCRQCYQQTNCNYCIFQINESHLNKKLSCPGFVNKKSIKQYFCRIFSYLQENPKAYEKALQETYTD